MAQISIIRERFQGEARVAVSADTVKKFAALGASVSVESGAGLASNIADEAYAQAGAKISSNLAEILPATQILLAVRAPDEQVVSALPANAIIVGMLDPYTNRAALAEYATKNLTSFSLEFLPRISRAQAMDVLSSQSNLAGYRAVIEGFNATGKAAPLMMTAAGTVAPARVLVLGAGVAGLQAIATAKRLGAIVYAFDVRAAVKEQVESLGAKFVEVPADEAGDAAGGYAKEMSAAYQQRQREVIAQEAARSDVIITTAQIPGKPAPVLLPESTVRGMKPGSVIIDMAASAGNTGGNCELTKHNAMIEFNGVRIFGYTDLPSRMAQDASPLYARNIFQFVSTLLLPEVKWDDELIKGTLLTRDGAIVHPQFARSENP